MRRTLRDDDQEEALVRDGYVVVPLLDDEAMSELLAGFAELEPADRFDPPGGSPTNPTTYHCTFLDTDRAYKVAFDELVRRIFGPLIDDLFESPRLLTANCYAKQPGKGDFEVHQNWTLTTDPSDLTVTVWVPLHDTIAANGTLAVIPGSHKLTVDIAYPRGDHYFSDYDDVLARDHFVPLELRAGEVVLFADDLIHGSQRNVTDTPRFALQVAVIPASARPVVWYPVDEDSFALLDAPGEFYLATTLAEIDSWPARFGTVATAANRNRRLPLEAFEERLEAGRRVRAELWGWPE